MANPSYFAGSHGFVIESGGNFATVQGNQILNYFNREPERKTALTVYDQVLQGDIHRTEDFGVHEYRRRWYDREPRFKKTICAAEVIGLEGRVFTVMSYTGPEAHEAFEEDFQKYSRTLTASPFQVYGINTNVPTVLFYNAAGEALGQCGILGKEISAGVDSPAQLLSQRDLVGSEEGDAVSRAGGAREGNCLPYLASLKARDVDRGVVKAIAGERSRPWPKVEVYQPTICSASTNATVAVGGGLWEACWNNDLGEREVMENGANRFMLKGKEDRFSVRIDRVEPAVWMSQALSVFHARGISLDDDLRQFELIIPELSLVGCPSTSETACQRRREETIYLFVGPLSPFTPTDVCWTSSLHHWSFDPTGQHPLPPKICEELGLPIKLFVDVYSTYPLGGRWNNEHYKWMHQYQVARGFDPKTTDFARHLGYRIYQVQSDSDRFEDVDAQSPPAISTSSSLGDLSEISYQPGTQHPPFQHAVSTPFNNPLPHPGTSASEPSTASHTSSTDSTYPNGLIHPGAVTTTSPVQYSFAAATSSVTTEGSTRAEGQLEEIAVPISEPILYPSITQSRMISKKANGTLPKKEPNPLLGNRRSINGKAVKDKEGTSAGKRKPPQTTQDEPAKEVLKSRETAVRANVNSQSPPKAISTSFNPCVSPRTPRNPASRLPTKSTPSVSIPPPKRPQIQPQESTRVQRSVTKNAANPGMTSGKATPGPSRTRTPLTSEPIRIGSSSPKLRTPQSAETTPSSTPSATPSSSIARI
ncbi:hypothetical protein V5O48_012789, partial [Marasmius crinis-equi]